MKWSLVRLFSFSLVVIGVLIAWQGFVVLSPSDAFPAPPAHPAVDGIAPIGCETPTSANGDTLHALYDFDFVRSALSQKSAVISECRCWEDPSGRQLGVAVVIDFEHPTTLPQGAPGFSYLSKGDREEPEVVYGSDGYPVVDQRRAAIDGVSRILVFVDLPSALVRLIQVLPSQAEMDQAGMR